MNQLNGSGDIGDGTLVFGKLQRVGSHSAGTSGPGTIFALQNISADIHINLNLDDLDVTENCTGAPYCVVEGNLCGCCYEDYGLVHAVGAISGQIIVGSNGDPIPEPNPTLFDGTRTDAVFCPPEPPFNEVKWEGLVIGNGETINPNLGVDYEQAANEIGNGSIGIPPYFLHLAELDPSSGYLSVGQERTALNPITIVHYGPVEWDSPSGEEPIIVESRPCAGGSWTTVPTSAYTVSYVENAPLRIIAVAFTGAFSPSTDYRLRPVTPAEFPTLPTGYSYLWSTQFSSTDFSVQDWTINYQVGKCFADINEDGEVNSDDQGILLSQFGQSSSTEYLSADLNNNGIVDSDDLGLLLGEFGSEDCGECPGGGGGGGMMMMGGGSSQMESGGACGQALHPAVQFLGFSEPCEYAAFVAGLSGTAIDAHILMLIDALETIGQD
ncbi:MAG: hypothetical protein ACTS3F_11460 [Phycisphaerales bacterium]